MINKIKIGYFADGPWSHEAFKLINADPDLEIKFICVRYDTKDETLLEFCERYSLPYLKHQNINSLEFIEIIKEYACDLFISMSFNQIFKSNILETPRLKTINCHAGKLPFYRGRNILNWALINDEKEFGITVHYIDEGIDTGDIILQRTYEISDSDNYATLLDKAHCECAIVLYDAVKLLQNGKITPIKQNSIHPLGFYCSQRKEGDEILDWHQTSRDVFNFVRAISPPGPSARTFLNNQKLKIHSVKIYEEAPVYKCIPGTILNKSREGLLVKTKDTFVLITDYEYDGKIRVGDRFDG